MALRQLVNPFFLYRNRDRIIPHLGEHRDRLINDWKLRKLKNRHYGGRCYIIGNGPSLMMDDLEQLKNEVTFASNKIYLAFDMTSWRPSYYVVEDDHMIEQHHKEICRYVSGTKLVNGKWKDLFRGERQVIWYPWAHTKAYEFPKFSGDARDMLYCGYMVTYISLQLAYFMGFTRVYLIGVDFHYLLNYSGQPSIEHAKHHQQDHFTPNYFKPGEKRYLPQLARAEQAMLCAKYFFEAHRRSIQNATRGGKLEVFQRVSLREALRN